MDIISHAVAGAAVGSAFNRPLIGAAIAILPDLPIIGPRRQTPPPAYLFTHSLIFLMIVIVLLSPFINPFLVFFALGSHLLLDVPTHSAKWSPCVLWPDTVPLWDFDEWEFFNQSWWIGFLITITWSILWILVPLL